MTAIQHSPGYLAWVGFQRKVWVHFLSGENYTKARQISSRKFDCQWELDDDTDISIAVGGVYEVMADDRIGSIEGGGQIQLGAQTLTVGKVKY